MKGPLILFQRRRKLIALLLAPLLYCLAIPTACRTAPLPAGAVERVKAIYTEKMPPRLRQYSELYGQAYIKSVGEVVNTTLVLTVMLLAIEYRRNKEMHIDRTVKSVLSSEEVWTGVYLGNRTAAKIHIVDKLLLSGSIEKPLVRTLLSVKSNIICLAVAEMGAGMAHEAFRGVRPGKEFGDIPFVFSELKQGNTMPFRLVMKNLLRIIDLRRDESRRLVADIFRDRIANLDFAAMMIGFGSGMLAGARCGAFTGMKLGMLAGRPAAGAAIGCAIGGAIGAVLFGAAISALSRNIIADIRTIRMNRLRRNILEDAEAGITPLCRTRSDGKTSVTASSDLREYLVLREKTVAARVFLFQRYSAENDRKKTRRELAKLKELYQKDLSFWNSLIAIAGEGGRPDIEACLIRFENNSVIQELTLSCVLELLNRDYTGLREKKFENRNGTCISIPGDQDLFEGMNIAP